LVLDWNQLATASEVTAVSAKKVVPEKRKSVRDNADWYFGWKEFGID